MCLRNAKPKVNQAIDHIKSKNILSEISGLKTAQVTQQINVQAHDTFLFHQTNTLDLLSSLRVSPPPKPTMANTALLGAQKHYHYGSLRELEVALQNSGIMVTLVTDRKRSAHPSAAAYEPDDPRAHLALHVFTMLPEAERNVLFPCTFMLSFVRQLEELEAQRAGVPPLVGLDKLERNLGTLPTTSGIGRSFVAGKTAALSAENDPELRACYTRLRETYGSQHEAWERKQHTDQKLTKEERDLYVADLYLAIEEIAAQASNQSSAREAEIKQERERQAEEARQKRGRARVCREARRQRGQRGAATQRYPTIGTRPKTLCW